MERKPIQPYKAAPPIPIVEISRICSYGYDKTAFDDETGKSMASYDNRYLV